MRRSILRLACALLCASVVLASAPRGLERTHRLSSPSDSELLATRYARDDLEIALTVTWARGGSVIDTVGINAAPAGSFSMGIDGNGVLEWRVYQPTAPDRYDWARLTVGPLARGRPHAVLLSVRGARVAVSLDGRPPRTMTLTVPLSGKPIWIGDYPGDSAWAPRYPVDHGMIGTVRVDYVGRTRATAPRTFAIGSKEQAIQAVAELPEVRAWRRLIDASRNTESPRRGAFQFTEASPARYVIRAYEIVPDEVTGGHTATFGWYEVDRTTGRARSITEEILGIEGEARAATETELPAAPATAPAGPASPREEAPPPVVASTAPPPVEASTPPPPVAASTPPAPPAPASATPAPVTPAAPASAGLPALAPEPAVGSGGPGPHYAWAGSIALTGEGLGSLADASGFARAPGGGWYVLDANFDRPRVLRFDEAGQLKAWWGGRGQQPGQLDFPRGLAVDAQGRVLVVNSYGEKLIQVFDASGKLLDRLVAPGAAAGQLKNPFGIATDPAGRILVVDATDYGHQGIKVFGPDGALVRSIGGKYGTEDGRFRRARGLAVDATGGLVATDSGRLQKFDASGNFVAKWGRYGHRDGDVNGESVSLLPDGRVVLCEPYYGRVKVFSPEGKLVTRFGRHGARADQFGRGVAAVADAQAIHVLDADKAVVHRFVPTDRPLAPGVLARAHRATWQVPGATGLAFGADGRLFVSTRAGTIQAFDGAGKPLATLGSAGRGDGQFVKPAALAVAPDGALVVADGGYDAQRIQRLDASGRFVSRFGARGAGPGQLDEPCALALDAAGNVWVCDTMNFRVMKFDATGKLLATFGQKGSSGADRGVSGHLSYPTGMAITPDGGVWTVEKNNGCLQKFDATGKSVLQLAGSGSGLGQLRFPEGLAIDRSGTLWIADSFNHRLQRVAPDGRFLEELGGVGEGAGEFCEPGRLAFGPRGELAVLERDGRIQLFEPVP